VCSSSHVPSSTSKTVPIEMLYFIFDDWARGTGAEEREPKAGVPALQAISSQWRAALEFIVRSLPITMLVVQACMCTSIHVYCRE
jgi:hypothetical protein